MRKLTVGSCFSGIGGLELGLERTGGFETRWQIELDVYARRVLEKNWPDVPKHGDIRLIQDGELESVDLICGGVPCQDISVAGSRAGLSGERSGLWTEMLRLIRALRPRFVLVENVPGLLSPIRERGRIKSGAPIGVILGDLAESGYDAEWDCFPASAFGADHQRDRVFVLAYPNGLGGRVFGRFPIRRINQAWAPKDQEQEIGRKRDLSLIGLRADSLRRATECGVRALVNGIPRGVVGYRLYGNSVVPEVSEAIGEMILRYVQETQ